jgi:hypothetical protein
MDKRRSLPTFNTSLEYKENFGALIPISISALASKTRASSHKFSSIKS